MKRFFLWIFVLTFLFTSVNVNSYYEYSDYYSESIKAFMNSPDKSDLERIENKIIKHCETVYLEATRRREYTKLELKYCSEVFEIKRQQEIDYMTYMLWNRGIY